MTRAVIRAEYARLVRPFVSTSEIRYYLNGFLIEPHETKGVYIVATDGHRMGIFHDEEGSADGCMIVRLDKWIYPLLRAEKGTRAMKRFLEVTDKPSRLSVHRNHPDSTSIFVASQGAATIDGTFPDWRAVVPKKLPEQKAAPVFNFDVFSAIGEVRGDDPHGTTCSFRLLGGGGLSGEPAVVLTNRKDFVGIVMPMRADEHARGYPVWFPKPTAVPKAADSAKVPPKRKRKAA